MSNAILIIGESGSGKTTAMRNLPPASTFYIDADKKGLSWRGWRAAFNRDANNYTATSDKDRIRALLDNISAKADAIHYIVIDTLNGIMLDDEFDRMGEKGYDKWADLAYTVYDLIRHAHDLRPDITVIFTAHAQTERDENTGEKFTRMLTNGRKLDKIRLESKFTTVLLSRRNGAGEYVFEVHANGSTAKTPLGMFEADEIPNDITTVIKAMEEF